MRITKLYIQNFRSIENLSLDFPHFYTAICGKNDAGKSNVIRVLRLLFKTTESPYCLALGMSSREIEPWKSVLFANRDKVVLVEGSIDREYINLLRRDVHGTNRFCFDGEIFSL